jgi:hypothetical protein
VGVEVVQDLGAVAVGEVDVVEVDRRARRQVVGAGPLDDLGALVEDLEDACRRSRARAGPS